MFGLEIQDISFTDGKGALYFFSYRSKEKRQYKNLPEEKQKVKTILFLLDQFCIGNAAYHELTMLCDGLPRSYLIKQCKDEMNKMSHIVRTPGAAHGAQLDFMSELESVVQGMVSYFLYRIKKPLHKKDSGVHHYFVTVFRVHWQNTVYIIFLKHLECSVKLEGRYSKPVLYLLDH